MVASANLSPMIPSVALELGRPSSQQSYDFFLINLGFYWWVHKEKNWGNAWTWFGSKRQSGVFPIVIVGELPIKWTHKKYKCQ